MVGRKWEKILGKSGRGKILNIPLDQISRNPYQPRRQFNESDLRELARSVQQYGVIQPIIVRRIHSGYQLIAGERRYRACQMVGVKEIPAIVREMDAVQAAEISLIENIQRKELNYFEEANAYQRLINDFGLTQEELARRIGKSQSAIANKMRLLKLPSEVRDLMVPEIISERHARALLRLNSLEIQQEVLQQIYDQELNVKETEELVEKLCQHNMPRESGKVDRGQSVSMVIRDARIFLNTIKETVKRARQTGIDMVMVENDAEAEYQITIKIPKVRCSQAAGKG